MLIHETELLWCILILVMSQPAEVTTTYLEMLAPPRSSPREAPPATLVMRCEQPTAAFYRFLYEGVGGAWQWHDRRKLADPELLAAIRSPGIEIHVLYNRGTPAGYSELNFSQRGQAKLEYFGLFPEFIGHGLGIWFLDWTVRQAWRPGMRRLWVHTCTLDHPSALPVYQKVGFQVYNRVVAPNPYL